MSESLALGRAAYDRQAWADACAHLAAADTFSPLAPDDLDRLATAAYLVGSDAIGVEARARAYQGYLDRGEPVPAAGSALWLAFSIAERRDRQAEAGGWVERARRLLEPLTEDVFERGFLCCLLARQKVRDGNPAAAHDLFIQAAGVGLRIGHRDLTHFARHGQGRTLCWMGRTAEGVAMLDDVMLAVAAGQLAPMVAGVVYCSVISACHDAFDLRRAQEWTTALSSWCAAHPDIVPFRGQCLVHRSELLQLHGAWRDATDEARRACERLDDGRHELGAGAAFYQQAELFRVCGAFDQAEAAYRRASQDGRVPQPGLALLRLAQGDGDGSEASIRSALLETRAPRARALLLRAAVDVLLAREEIDAARQAAEELGRLCRDDGPIFLRASSAQAAGAVALAAGDVPAAVESLRTAWSHWRELDAPYEIARVRTQIGLAYRALGDEEGARLEFDAAQEAFERLGAAPDAARLAQLMARAAPLASGGLTGREVEVLRLVASGKTNRAIASDLEISEKTVARHVSNIFTKLDLSSRSGATAYAYEHKLLAPST